MVVPFLEFSLPFLLKFFPSLLPSTFEKDPQKRKDVIMQQQLHRRLELAALLNDLALQRSQSIGLPDVPASTTNSSVSPMQQRPASPLQPKPASSTPMTDSSSSSNSVQLRSTGPTIVAATFRAVRHVFQFPIPSSSLILLFVHFFFFLSSLSC